MKKTLLLFWNTLRRGRLILVVALACGVALCFVYNALAGLVGGQYGGIPVGLLAHEETAVTRDFRTYLAEELGMEVAESPDIGHLHTELVERHVAAVIEVPAGFEAALLRGAPIPLEVSFLDDYANAAFVRGYLETYTASLAALAGGARDAAQLGEMLAQAREALPPVHIQAATGTTLAAVAQRDAFRQVMGFYLMFGFLLAFATALQLFDDRQNGLYNRVRATNVRTVQYLGGICAAGMANALALIAPVFAYLLAARPDIGMHMGQAVALCLLYAFFVVGVALVAALYLASKSAITAGIIGAATILCLLGGAYFPIDTSPLFLQRLARATPQFWFIEAVGRLQEDPAAPWWQNALVIALFALFCFILAGARFVGRGRRRAAA